MIRLPSTREAGSALILAMFVLALLLGMGTSLLFMTQTDLRLSHTSLDTKRAFYLAEAGIEDARRTLFAANSASIDFDDDLVAAAGADGVVDFDPDSLVPTYGTDGEIIGFAGFNDDVALRPLTPFAAPGETGGYIAFLTNDGVDGTSSTSDGNQRVMLTAVGIGGNRTMETVQAIVEPYRHVPSLPPAALTLLGVPQYDNGTATQAHVGDDCQGAGTPGLFVPVVGVVGNGPRSAVQGALQGPSDFTSGPYTGQDTVGDIDSLSDPIVGAAGLGTVDPMWKSCAAVQKLISELHDAADAYCDSGAGTCVAAAGAPGYLQFFDGDLTVAPGSHQGILVVTGSVTFSGDASWDGLVLVLGEGEWTRNGAGSGQVRGGAVVAAIAGPNGVHGDADDCTENGDGFGTARYTAAGGAPSEVHYCSSRLATANPVQTLEVVDFLQR